MVSLNKVAFVIITILIGFLYRRYMDKEECQQQLRDLHIINRELLTKNGKPILWIPVPRVYNARDWSSFYSRSSDSLNVPYMYLTIKSIIEKCGQTFQICIIDDDSFGKLLPNWTPELNKIGDPLREKVRYLGMIELLYTFGGILVPPSFLCMRDLGPLLENGKPFVAEGVNYYGDSRFAPNPYFLGAKPECSVMKEYADYLAIMITNDYTAESIFLNDLSKWCARRCASGEMHCLDGKKTGAKTVNGDAIIIEHFFEQQPQELASDTFGILIPHEQIEKRTSLNWVCYLEKEKLLEMDNNFRRYLQKSMN